MNMNAVPFPLFSLPHVVAREVIKMMDIKDIVNMTKMSRKAKRDIRSLLHDRCYVSLSFDRNVDMSFQFGPKTSTAVPISYTINLYTPRRLHHLDFNRNDMKEQVNSLCEVFDTPIADLFVNPELTPMEVFSIRDFLKGVRMSAKSTRKLKTAEKLNRIRYRDLFEFLGNEFRRMFP